ncbi:tRNA (adenosine(37)-N6)-dimethylallyltransferase MiaA [Anabaena cylindrica UHCC 0172]|uniref:tRNA (adenosine(37)-N6)-dimethylallyltransferase MiaA n=1 Tax=Anabaena cylindrica TaxID=1165 RepID=UPI002B1F5AAC|nr:tRNA (adenosine(37)-N6)-dimethylallyltransferase MiaA [Anabaena cylindrica]MEA5549698.1 tRNA (adenosine(37)-N6)-dimethylallyltransferase MiaA [Anabaena cylindrica UHCC 0172]
MTKLIVICGATATGKSGLALSLAKRLGSVILSADSRQVYRDFDIGTAKPTLAEQELVPHYLIDICDPTEIMTLADYQEQTQALISSLEVSPVLLVGGTGLYIRSIVQGMKIPRVSPQPELRSQLESLGQSQLYPILQQVDAIAAKKIHANDLVRTLRALEVYYVTGIPISDQQGENPPNYPILQICLDCDAERLDIRISRRTEQMIADGLVAEVEYLSQKYGADLPLLNTLGYQEIKQYLAGEISLDETKELIVLHTRQFAKRQRTWFRQAPNMEYVDMDNPNLLEQIWERINKFV